VIHPEPKFRSLPPKPERFCACAAGVPWLLGLGSLAAGRNSTCFSVCTRCQAKLSSSGRYL
jgi:hypothetical protein